MRAANRPSRQLGHFDALIEGMGSGRNACRGRGRIGLNGAGESVAKRLFFELGEGEQHVESHIRRPIEVVVLNCCVTETNEAS
jgi:hypothetical protein